MNPIYAIDKAPRGTRAVYHTGLLALDRSTDNKRAAMRKRVDAAATEAAELSRQGKVALVQKRVKPFVFDYLAVRL